LRICL